MLHKSLKKYPKMNNWRAILQLAEDVAPVENLPEDSNDWWSDVTMDHPSGWKVVFFYDGDELDYISEWITPDGTVFDHWSLFEGMGNPWKDEYWLKCWRSCKDLPRLIKARQEYSIFSLAFWKNRNWKYWRK